MKLVEVRRRGLGGANMIRIALVDDTSSVKHVEFRVVPVTNDKEFACFPDGLLSLRSVMRLSCKVKAGRRVGEMGKYLWYRVKDAPADQHKTSLANEP